MYPKMVPVVLAMTGALNSPIPDQSYLLTQKVDARQHGRQGGYMRCKEILPSLLGGFAALAVSIPFACAGEKLTADEIQSLFSGKRVEGYHERRGFHFVRIYRSDGTAVENSEHGSRSGVWRTNKSGQLCQSFGKDEMKCRTVANKNGLYRQYKTSSKGKQKLVTTYRHFSHAGNQGGSVPQKPVYSFSSNINQRDEKGELPIHKAAREGRLETIKQLITVGSDINAKTIDGRTPLMWAVTKEYFDIAVLLVENGAEVNAKYNGPTPLMEAAKVGSVKMAEMLLAHGAAINARNHSGETALYLATYHSHRDVMKLLIAKGADLDAKTKYSWSPIHIAVFRNDPEVAEQLLRAGAQVGRVDGTDEGVYATAHLYRLAAEFNEQEGRYRTAGQQFQIASTYFQKASERFKARAEELSSRITRAQIGSALSMIFAHYQAQQQAHTNTVLSPSGKTIGIGVANYQVTDTTSIEDLKRIYEDISRVAREASETCRKISECHTPTANPGKLATCRQSIKTAVTETKQKEAELNEP